MTSHRWVLAVVIAGLLAACSSGGEIERSATDAVRIAVTPDAAIDQQVGDVRITAAAGAVAQGGTITAEAADIVDPPTEVDGVDVEIAPSGVRIDLGEVKLGTPLSLQFPADVELDAGEVAVGIHQAEDGSWQLVPDAVIGDSTVTVTTADFSIVSWATTKILKPVANLFARAIGGRSDPSDCGQAPSWATVAPPKSGADHACVRAKGQPDQAELEIKSNRGTFHWIRLPEQPSRQYLWVEDQPDLIRTAISNLAFGGSETAILLAPGKRMTVGYTRPGADTSAAFVSYDDVWSLAASFVYQLVDAAFGLVAPDVTHLLVAKCAGVLDIPAVVPSGAGAVIQKPTLSEGLATCLVDLVGSLGDPKKAVNLAVEVLGVDAPAATLGPLSEKLQSIGARASAVGKVLNKGRWVVLGLTSLLDLARQQFDDGVGDMTLQLTAAPAAPTGLEILADRVGAVRLGMTEAEAVAAGGLTDGEPDLCGQEIGGDPNARMYRMPAPAQERITVLIYEGRVSTIAVSGTWSAPNFGARSGMSLSQIADNLRSSGWSVDLSPGSEEFTPMLTASRNSDQVAFDADDDEIADALVIPQFQGCE